MKEKTLPRLLVSREKAQRKIETQIKAGEKLRDREIHSREELKQAKKDCRNWSKGNKDILVKLFGRSSIERNYNAFSYCTAINSDSSTPSRPKEAAEQLLIDLDAYRARVGCYIDHLTAIQARYGIYDKPSVGTNIFIGHGHSQNWRELKDFVNERLKLPYDEFNRVPVAGISNTDRLATMLDQARMAFLVMTAEDEQTDGTLRARENVVHEVGLLQGRLGFERAIILLEEGCEEFSNIHGLGQIRFPKGNIKAVFEEIRQVLEREGIL